jgi:hypothetical protein
MWWVSLLQIHRENDDMLASLASAPRMNNMEPIRTPSKEQLQARIAVELLELDKELGKKLLDTWEDVARGSEEIRDQEFETFGDFLHMRIRDVAAK